MLQFRAKQSGFTLIELSIVLVIVGLLVGGVIVGRDLVRNAQVRKQIKQIEQYQSAYNAFKLKYNCLPGDCIKATTFFPAATNGNGNQRVSVGIMGTYSQQWLWTDSNFQEIHQFLYQLGQSELIAFRPNVNTDEVGVGIPSLEMDKSKGFFASDSYSFVDGWSPYRSPDMTSYKTGNNLLWLVKCDSAAPDTLLVQYMDEECGIFTPLDLKSIDQKMDNGLPLTGKFLGFSGGNTPSGYEDKECVNPGRTDYNLTNTGKWCQAAVVLD